MVTFEGTEYYPWKDGRYRCPWPCSDPNYPKTKWKTDKGFAKHLSECRAKPDPVRVWKPEPEGTIQKYADCPDCGRPIWKYRSCWKMPERTVCIDCYAVYHEAGMGFHDCAGLVLPETTMEI